MSNHCVKCVQIRSFFWSVFSPNAGKYGLEKAPYLDTFHSVNKSKILLLHVISAVFLLSDNVCDIFLPHQHIFSQNKKHDFYIINNCAKIVTSPRPKTFLWTSDREKNSLSSSAIRIGTMILRCLITLSKTQNRSHS